MHNTIDAETLTKLIEKIGPLPIWNLPDYCKDVGQVQWWKWETYRHDDPRYGRVSS